jgi:hypothetical protein
MEIIRINYQCSIFLMSLQTNKDKAGNVYGTVIGIRKLLLALFRTALILVTDLGTTCAATDLASQDGD